MPVVTTLAAPETLTGTERAYWDFYMPRLAAVRVLTDVDRHSLANHCIALAQVVEIREAQQSPTYRRLVSGRTNPLDAQLRAWLQIARLSAAELGLSPVSRARVTPAGPDTQETDDLDAFIATPLRRVQ
jgi:P27 family predicted phage terminase small subunit